MPMLPGLVWTASVALAGVGAGPPPEGLERSSQARRIAVVVGIDDYTTDASLADLRFAGADARAVGEVLQDDGYEVWKLVGAVQPDAFWRTLRQATATAQRNDLVLVYFAGHAQLRPEPEQTALQLLFSDSQSADPWSGISLASVETAMSDLQAQHRVVIIDACYSRRTQALLQSTDRGPVPAVQLPSVGRYEAWIFAAAPEQTAQEDVDLGHGVFTWYLLEALSGRGDLDGDGQVGAQEAFSHAGQRTAEHTRYAQVPRMSADRVGWGDLPLVGSEIDPSRAVLPWGDSGWAQWQLIVDGAPRGPGALDAGVHQFQLVATDGTVSSGRLQVDAGETLSLSRLNQRLGGRPTGDGGQPASANNQRRRDGPVVGTAAGIVLGVASSPVLPVFAVDYRVLVFPGSKPDGRMLGLAPALRAGVTPFGLTIGTALHGLSLSHAEGRRVAVGLDLAPAVDIGFDYLAVSIAPSLAVLVQPRSHRERLLWIGVGMQIGWEARDDRAGSSTYLSLNWGQARTSPTIWGTSGDTD